MRTEFEETRKKRDREFTEQIETFEQKLHESQSQLTLTRRELESLKVPIHYHSENIPFAWLEETTLEFHLKFGIILFWRCRTR